MLASSSTWLVYSRTICYGQLCCSSWRPRKTSAQKCRTRYQTKLTTNSRIFTLEPNTTVYSQIESNDIRVTGHAAVACHRPADLDIFIITTGSHNYNVSVKSLAWNTRAVLLTLKLGCVTIDTCGINSWTLNICPIAERRTLHWHILI